MSNWLDDFKVAFNSVVKAKLVELSGSLSDLTVQLKEAE